MEEQPNNQQRISLSTFLPEDWFAQPEQSSVWITGFQIANVAAENFSTPFTKINLGDVVALILFGELNYLDPGNIVFDFSVPGQLHVNAPPPVQKRSPIGGWLLLMTPFVVDGAQRSEAEVRQNISAAAGFLAAFNGRNMVYEQVFHNVLEVQSGRLTIFSVTVVNPSTYPTPDLSSQRLNLIETAKSHLSQQPTASGNRVLLSLRWYEASLRSTGVDSFLQAWIAIEVLVMDDTNIRPINDALSRIYGIAPEEAKRRFNVGRIFGIRGRIVHNGELISISQPVTDYLEAIYVDVLYEILGLATEHRVDAQINSPTTNILRILNEV